MDDGPARDVVSVGVIQIKGDKLVGPQACCLKKELMDALSVPYHQVLEEQTGQGVGSHSVLGLIQVEPIPVAWRLLWQAG